MSRDGAPKPGTMQERAHEYAYKASEADFFDSPYVVAWGKRLAAFAAAEVAEAVRVEREAYVFDGARGCQPCDASGYGMSGAKCVACDGSGSINIFRARSKT